MDLRFYAHPFISSSTLLSPTEPLTGAPRHIHPFISSSKQNLTVDLKTYTKEFGDAQSNLMFIFMPK